MLKQMETKQKCNNIESFSVVTTLSTDNTTSSQYPMVYQTIEITTPKQLSLVSTIQAPAI